MGGMGTLRGREGCPPGSPRPGQLRDFHPGGILSAPASRRVLGLTAEGLQLLSPKVKSSYRSTPKLHTSDWHEKTLSERDSGAYLGAEHWVGGTGLRKER